MTDVFFVLGVVSGVFLSNITFLWWRRRRNAKQINPADLRHIKVSPDGYRHSKYPNGDAPPSEWKYHKNN